MILKILIGNVLWFLQGSWVLYLLHLMEASIHPDTHALSCFTPIEPDGEGTVSLPAF